jgi:hypothetical protein
VAAFAGAGIETNNPVIKVVTTIETIFGRAALTFMRTKPKITFTSLLGALARGIEHKTEECTPEDKTASRGDIHP